MNSRSGHAKIPATSTAAAAGPAGPMGKTFYIDNLWEERHAAMITEG